MTAMVVSGLLASCSSGGGGSSGGSEVGAGSSPVLSSTSASNSAAATPTAAPGGAAATDVVGPPALGAPDGDAFWVPPAELPGDGPGDIIWARPLEDPPQGALGWLVLYRSESVAGDPIAVSGMVVAPIAPPAGAPHAVLTWAHGTTGLADECAPTRTRSGGGFSPETILASMAVGRGWTFVATDYEGLGTPGVHPYLVGPSEGRGVLDIVRAAAQLEGSGVTASSPVAIFGHSQGGHAALMAAELAGSYAPELDVIGTVAGAPPGDLPSLAAQAGVLDGFGLMVKAGFLAAYPDLPVDAAADAAAAPLLEEVEETCTSGAFALAGRITTPQPDPSEDPGWSAALRASSPGTVVPGGPVLIFHGSADTTVPPQLSLRIRDDYCALGVTVQRTVYPDRDHTGVILPAIGEIQTWIQGRIDGTPAPDNCATPQTA